MLDGVVFVGFLTILAIILAPLVAIQVSILLEERKEAKQRRLNIFKTLMAARATPESPESIQALNMIDVEFYGKEEGSKEVVYEWKAFLDHLADESLDDEEWERKKIDLFNQLLYTMAKSLGFEFNKIYFQRAGYCPVAGGKSKEEIIEERKRITFLLSESEIPQLSAEANPHSEEMED